MNAPDHIEQEEVQPSNLTMLRDMMAGLPDEDRAKVEQAAMKVRSAIQDHGPEAVVAIALVAAELDEGVEGERGI